MIFISYVNYHKHDDISNILLTDSVAKLEDYAKRAVELGHTVLSSCNHGTPGDYRLCYDLAKKYGLHWRYVAEAYFVKDRLAEDESGKRDRKNCHIILAAKTEKGIGDLNEVLSEANISGYYFRPRVDMELLLRLDPRDVFVTSACIAGVWAYGFENDKETGEWSYDFTKPDILVRQLHAHFGDSFMLEVQSHNVDKQKAVNAHILDLYRKEGIKIIAGMDSHFIYPEDKALRDMRLEANGLHYDDEDGFKLDYPSDEEAFCRFEEQGILSPAQIQEAMDNTNVFLEFDDVEFDKSKKLPTIYPNLTQEERNEKYRKLVTSKWEEYKKTVPPERWPEYEAGIKYEMDVITSTNTSDYFLLDYEIVKKAKENGGQLTYSGRGSGPSFYTNSLLGFSSIDRFALPVTMYPDRFISADRLKAGSLPDLDLNEGNVEVFADAQQQVMGEWHAAPMIAYGTLKRLAAWKMYCRANNVPFDVANELSDNLKAYELDYKHADDDEKDEIKVEDYVPEKYHEYLKASEKYLGMVDSISPHPCAYLICNNDIRREVGIFRINSKTGKKKIVYAAFIDGATADAYGYLKNDHLAVSIVKLNADIYKRIGIPQPSVPELLKMTETDKPTWDIYANGWTLGINQAEKEKSTEKVMRYKPKNISELSAFVAGIRPGFASMAPKLFNRERFTYGIPVLDQMIQTKEMPNSFILYQEQVMMMLQWAGFQPSESYAAIKAIAKKHPEKVLPMKERFLKGFTERLIREANVSKEDAPKTSDMVWKIIEDNTGYAFNACVVGSTMMWRGSNGIHPFRPTVEEMYKILNDKDYAKKTKHRSLHDKYKREGYGTALSLGKDNRIHDNRIVDIRYQGKRDVYKLTTASGLSVVCTDNHKFPVGSYDNLIQLKELKIGDKLFVHGEYEKHPDVYRFTDGNYENNFPQKGECGFRRHTDGPSVVYNETRIQNIENKKSCEHCGVSYSEEACFELHHVDGDRTNNCHENYAWLCNSCHKKAHYKMGRVKRYQKGIPSWQDEIVSIEYAGEEDVYDVEMAAPNHNFVLDNGLVVGNSHSVSVALDSLYTAWAKAHYPYETYISLLSLYAEKKDKDRIAKAKQEMFKAFGIRIVPCKFRQDNRSYFVDKDAHTISDALTSVKGISSGVAGKLYQMRNNQYDCAVDLFYDLEVNTSINSAVIKTLIQMGYFEEFGSSGKLLKLYQEFREGESKFSKAHVKATQEKRLDTLRQIEQKLPEQDIPVQDQMAFEVEYYGTPLSTYPKYSGYFAILEVDDKYSPKVKMYNIAKGTVGVMKMRKTLYKLHPVAEGNVIRLIDWKRKPAYQYIDGKQTVKEGVFDLWIQDYEIISASPEKET